MNRKIANLAKALEAYPEAAQISKLATIAGLKSLGLDDTGARLFNAILGDRWDFIIANWMLSQSLYGEESFKTMRPRFSPFKDNIAQNLKALTALDKLSSLSPDARKAFYATNIQCRFLDGWIEANGLDAYAILVGESLSEETLTWLRRDSNRTPDEVIAGYRESVIALISDTIRKFISSDFIIDVLSNKWLPPAQAKKLSYSEAMDKWSEWKGPKFDVILDMGDGWKWVDAGTGHSEWIRHNLKNCGTASWGALRAKDTSKNMMFILMDANNKPHGITTYNSEYVDIWEPDEPPKKYLGYVEGLGSSQLKSIYYPYFLKLVDYLKPDVINIPHAGTYDSKGKVADNEDLRKLINPDKLRK